MDYPGKKTNKKKKKTFNQLLHRYVLTGGALGLYFGLFFRPLREPNVLLALVLGFLAALAIAVLRAIRERPSLRALLVGWLKAFVTAVFILLLLEARHPVYDFGGKLAVSIYTTICGAATGAWYAYDIRRRKKAEP